MYPEYYTIVYPRRPPRPIKVQKEREPAVRTYEGLNMVLWYTSGFL